MTTATLAQRAEHHKTKSIVFPSIPWKLWFVTAIVSLICLSIGYIWLVNRLTSGTYLIKNATKEIEQVTADNRLLETRFAQSSFLGNVQEKVRALSFEKTAQVKYVHVADDTLGMAK